MAKNDETEEKSLPPSATKLQRLRDQESTVPRSKDIPSALSGLAVAIYLCVSIHAIIAHFDVAFTNSFQTMDGFKTMLPSSTVRLMAGVLADIIGPAFLIAMLAGTIGAILDGGGFFFSFKSLKLDMDRLNPISGLKKIFELASLAELGKQTFKLILIAVGGTCAIMSLTGGLLWAPMCGEVCSIEMAGYTIGALALISVSVMVLAAIADIKISRVLFRHEHRMTKTEMKRENKEAFGDPHMRQARRNISLASARKVDPRS